MPQFTIALAHTTLGIKTLYDYSYKLCNNYFTQNKADIHLCTNQKDIDCERKFNNEDARQLNKTLTCLPDPVIESMALYRKISKALLMKDNLLIHGSAVAVQDDGYLFTAPSGVGKSTHAQLWKKLLGDKMRYINDDKPLIGFQGTTVQVFGTPWCGKHQRGENTHAHLLGIVILKQGNTNSISKLSPTQAFPLLYPQTYSRYNSQQAKKAIHLVARLVKYVPCYSLSATPSLQAAQLCYNTLIEQQDKTIL